MINWQLVLWLAIGFFGGNGVFLGGMFCIAVIDGLLNGQFHVYRKKNRQINRGS